MNEVNRLREDATTTAYDILKNVQENYVTVEEVKDLREQVNELKNQFNIALSILQILKIYCNVLNAIRIMPFLMT